MCNKIEDNLREISESIDINLKKILSKNEFVPSRLLQAIKYSTFGVGKRVRAFLLIESFKICCQNDNSKFFHKALTVATAVEIIHSYSLIHDDLPSMDNSDLRRGKASLHVAFDEGTAILVGDALQSLAFEILSDPKNISDSNIRSQICLELSKSIGYRGMIAGQMLDLIAENRFGKTEINQKDIHLIQNLKTGQLIKFAVLAGAIIGNANNMQKLSLNNYADKIGIAFQIKDDLLDVESNEKKLGKPTNKDKKSGKNNLINLLGYKKSRVLLNKIIIQAKNDLKDFKERNNKLLDFADFVEKRKK